MKAIYCKSNFSILTYTTQRLKKKAYMITKLNCGHQRYRCSAEWPQSGQGGHTRKVFFPRGPDRKFLRGIDISIHRSLSSRFIVFRFKMFCILRFFCWSARSQTIHRHNHTAHTQELSQLRKGRNWGTFINFNCTDHQGSAKLQYLE